jgi:hypothetical protein
MFAWEAQKSFDAVIYQTCGQREVDAIAGELADKLRGYLGEDVVKLPHDRKLQAVKDWLKQRRSLLVLDDLWQGAETLSAGPPASVLFTSRDAQLADARLEPDRNGRELYTGGGRQDIPFLSRPGNI